MLWYLLLLKLKRWPDSAAQWLAWHLPRRVAMWATIRLAAHATTGEWGNTVTPGVTITEMLQRWGVG